MKRLSRPAGRMRALAAVVLLNFVLLNVTAFGQSAGEKSPAAGVPGGGSAQTGDASAEKRSKPAPLPVFEPAGRIDHEDAVTWIMVLILLPLFGGFAILLRVLLIPHHNGMSKSEPHKHEKEPEVYQISRPPRRPRDGEQPGNHCQSSS